MSERVSEGSLLTLHYRLATDEGIELVSTFDGGPATLQMGAGELAPSLEACLIGLPVGEDHVFMLPPDQGFGARSADLIQRLAKKDIPGGAELQVSGVVEFSGPDGSRFSGMVREISGDEVVMDFNHPLAGRAVRFEVRIIGVLA